jgi:GNAT superfamily N-acetyltransferase
MSLIFKWRGQFENSEVNALHAEAFDTRTYSNDEWNWREILDRHSFGWVVARDESRLVGFVNALWDGFSHVWVQDTMVDRDSQHRGVGTEMIAMVREESRNTGCEWLHVDFEIGLSDFYVQSCGFTPTTAGLIRLD